MPGEGGEIHTCSSCGDLLIGRFGYQLGTIGMQNGHHGKCGVAVDGVGMP
ncbi:MAG: hypothetical protein MZV70_58795 [Desulfobacterales bacterium]|nr:hypothetical protein [Desulfobacterales bacterium]